VANALAYCDVATIKAALSFIVEAEFLVVGYPSMHEL
jgi:hypothetical protein